MSNEIVYDITQSTSKRKIQSNIVNGKKLREIQLKVLEDLANAIVNRIAHIMLITASVNGDFFNLEFIS